MSHRNPEIEARPRAGRGSGLGSREELGPQAHRARSLRVGSGAAHRRDATGWSPEQVPLPCVCVCVSPEQVPLPCVCVCLSPDQVPLPCVCVCVSPEQVPLPCVCVCVSPEQVPLHLYLYSLPLKPAPPNPKPLTFDTRRNLNPQPSTLNPQPSTLNPQPSTLNPQPSTLNPKP